MSPLTPQQARLQDDLRGLVQGDVRCDDITSQLYATDASMFECRPLGVIWPKSTNDVVAAVRYAAEKGLSVHPRGAGTGAVGGALGAGLILDFSRYMKRLLSVGEDYAEVAPGVVRERLNNQLRRTKQRFFAPSAGHFPTCTIGSILAGDYVGPRWLRYGFPHDHLLELEIVTAEGNMQILRPEPYEMDSQGQCVPHRVDPNVPALLENSNGLWRKLFLLLRENDSLIQEEQPDNIPECGGYRLNGVLRNGVFDPTRLITGSEGTLGIITRAKISTSPLRTCSGAVVFLFDGMEKAARSIPFILEYRPTLCDMVDRRMINMVCEWDHRFVPLFPSDTEVAIVIEIDADSQSELNERMNGLIHCLRQKEQLSFGFWQTFHSTEKELLRDFLRKAKGALLRIRHPLQIVTLLEDIRVPLESLLPFLYAVQNILKKQSVTYSISGHWGHGQIRILPILDPSLLKYQELIRQVADQILAEVFRVKGTIGSAQGTGLARSFALTERYPKLSSLFVDIKNLFDPQNILNPNKVVTESMRQPVDALRLDTSGPLSETWPGLFRTFTLAHESVVSPEQKYPKIRDQLELQLKWDPKQVTEATFQCTGCGLCRIRTLETRMCPIFRSQPIEDNVCRSKANLLRGVLDGSLPLTTLTEEMSRQIADGCLFCHCCQSECPAQSDIPELVFRIKSAWNASHGLPLREKFLTNIDTFLHTISFFNWPFGIKKVRKTWQWLFKNMLGFSKRQRLPEFIRFNPLVPAIKKKYLRPTRLGERKVALFLDTYATYFDPQLLEAAVKVLEHNQVDVYIPPHQKSSGHDAFVFGDAERAEWYARHNIIALTEAVRQRYPIVTMEPMSAVCLRKEYGYVRKDDDAKTLAANTTDLCSWLYRLHQEGRLKLDFTPIRKTIGYHAPCRTIALQEESLALSTPAQELLLLIPGLKVQRLERGCCGLSGTIGMLKQNDKRGLKLANPLILALRDTSLDMGATECPICKTQMEQRTEKPTIHPIKLLAMAYGLMTEGELNFPMTRK